MSSMYAPFGGGTPTRQCQRCGISLPPYEVYCRNCGEYNAPMKANAPTEHTQPPSAMVWGEPIPQTSYGGGSFAGQQWEQASAPPAQNGPHGGAPPSQQMPFPNNYYGSPGSFPASNNYYASPQQAVYVPPPSTAMNGFQPGQMNGFPMGYERPPEQKSGPNLGLIVGIVLLLLLLVGGGIGGYVFVKDQNHTTTTPSVTPTAAPSPTPSAKPLFRDTFHNNTNGWYLAGSSNGKISVKLGGGSLILEDDENTLFPEFVPSKTFADFQLNVDATLSNGDQNNGYGVYIRVTSTQNDELGTYYRFELYGDGTFAIFKGTVDASGNSSADKIVDFTANNAIKKQGGLNHMTILAKGSSMVFIVNGVTLHTLVDTSYRSGSMALFVSNVKGTNGGAQATFSHLAVYPLTA